MDRRPRRVGSLARCAVEASLRPIGKTVSGHLVMLAPDGRLFEKRASGGVVW